MDAFVQSGFGQFLNQHFSVFFRASSWQSFLYLAYGWSVCQYHQTIAQYIWLSGGTKSKHFTRYYHFLNLSFLGRLDQLWACVWDLDKQTDYHWRTLVAVSKADQWEETQIEQVVKVRDFLEELEESAQDALGRIDKLRAKNQEDSVDELNSLIGKFQTHLSQNGRFRKKMRKLPKEILSSLQDPSPQNRQVQPESEPLTGKEAIVQALHLADIQIEALIKKNVDSFASYSSAELEHPEIKQLLVRLYMHIAELYYRLEKGEKAEDYWKKVMLLDPFNHESLYNLAVCRMVYTKDQGAILSGWKQYAELLYLKGILLKSPRKFAESRIEFHNSFGSSFSIPYLRQELSPKNSVNPDSFLSLLNTPGRLKEYLSHKLAAFLNQRILFSVPNLLLGVERTASPDKLEEAANKLKEFIGLATAELTPKVAKGFARVCIEYTDFKLRQANEATGIVLVKYPQYQSEESQLLDWIVEVYLLKLKIFQAFKGTEDWFKKVKNIDFLFLLDKLMILPADLSREYLYAAVQKLRLGQPEAVVDALNRQVFENFVMLIKHGLEEETDEDLKLGYFNQMVRSLDANRFFWQRFAQSKLGDWVNVIDDPMGLYSKTIRSSFEKGASKPKIEVGIKALIQDWVEKYPMLVGPANRLAILLLNIRRPQEAIPYLEKAIETGYFEKSKEESQKLLQTCQEHSQHIAIKEAVSNGNYQEGLALVRNEIDQAPSEIRWIETYIQTFQQWQGSSNQPNLSEREEFVAYVQKWVQNTESIPEYNSENQDEEKSREMEKRAQIIELLKNEQVNVSMAHIESAFKKDSKNKWERVIQSMNSFLKEDPDLEIAQFYFMVGNFRILVILLNNRQSDEANDYLQKAKEFAGKLSSSSNENFSSNANTILEQIKQAEGR